MNAPEQVENDWFDWAEAHRTDWKAQDARQRVAALEWRAAISTDTGQVLEFAQQAALSLGHDAVGAEHLLAALLKLNRGTAAQLLKDAGLSLPALRMEIETDRGLGAARRQDIPWTPRASGIMQRARAVAQAESRLVEPEDILFELLGEKAGFPARLFSRRTIDGTKMRSDLATKAAGGDENRGIDQT